MTDAPNPVLSERPRCRDKLHGPGMPELRCALPRDHRGRRHRWEGILTTSATSDTEQYVTVEWAER